MLNKCGHDPVTIEVIWLRHNMYVCGVRLGDFSHFEWQELNIERGSQFAAFLPEVKQVRQTCSVW